MNKKWAYVIISWALFTFLFGLSGIFNIPEEAVHLASAVLAGVMIGVAVKTLLD